MPDHRAVQPAAPHGSSVYGGICDCVNGVLVKMPDGLTTGLSGYGPKATMDRLEAAVRGRGMTILAHIDHAAAAARAGMELRPTEVLIFGNPTTGTPLMKAAQTMGIDLPLKALVRQDEEGKTRLAYNAPTWLAGRHGADAGADRILGAMTAALAAVAKEATTQPMKDAS